MTPSALNMPTYEEVVELSNSELMKRMKHITSQINEAISQGQSTTDLAHIYKCYEEEWFKRLAFAWHKTKST
jgi:hypothetical protein